MKKNLKSLAAILVVVLLMGALLAGCAGGGDANADPIVGKWSLTDVEANGETYSLEDYKALAEASGVDTEVISVTFDIKADGTFSGDALGQTAEGTWVAGTDGAYTFTIDGVDQEMTITDGKLVMERDGMALYLSK